MKLYLDDVRDPDPSWILARTAGEAIHILQTEKVELVSLDHDLGMNPDGELAPTGYDVLCWLEEQVLTQGYPLPQILVHSANPPARIKMEGAIRRLEERVHGG